jgi:hypothetical protein
MASDGGTGEAGPVEGRSLSDDPEHVHEAADEEAGPPGLAAYRDREHQAHPEGQGGDDLGHLHEAIEEERER